MAFAMNSAIPLYIYVLQKLNGKRRRKKSELELARQYIALGDLYPHCHKLKVVSGTWFSM